MGGEKRIWITFLEVDGVEESNNQVCGINLNRIGFPTKLIAGPQKGNERAEEIPELCGQRLGPAVCLPSCSFTPPSPTFPAAVRNKAVWRGAPCPNPTPCCLQTYPEQSSELQNLLCMRLLFCKRSAVTSLSEGIAGDRRTGSPGGCEDRRAG